MELLIFFKKLLIVLNLQKLQNEILAFVKYPYMQ